MKKILIIILLLFSASAVFSEVIYLKDGQIIEGTIIQETVNYLLVKTQFQTRRVWRRNIKRIMIPERKMEQVFLLLNNGDVLEGYMVDQDNDKVYFKDKLDSPVEKSILKSKIKQISPKQIIPLNVGITPRFAYFIPLNSGGAELKPAIGYLMGVDMNLSWLKNSKIQFETGYIKSNSSSNDSQYMLFYPFMLGLAYSIPISVVELLPRIGAGLTLLNFDDGEGKKLQSFAYTGMGGLMLQYAIIKKHLFVHLAGEYRLLMESGTMLHTIILSGGISYRF